MALASPALAQTTVTSFDTSFTAPGVWFENDVRPGGTASITDLTGLGGDLENNQPLSIGAALLTTDFTNPAKAEVAVFNDYGTPDNIFSLLNIMYSYHKATNTGQNSAAAPSLKLTFNNQVCDDPVSANDCFGTLVYEPTWNGAGSTSMAPASSNPATDTWTQVTINDSMGLFWWTGGFGQPNTAGGPPIKTLAGWKAAFSSDFGDATLILVSVGVGSFNQGQIGYFDEVIIDGTNADASYDFEPAPLTCVQPPSGLVSWWPGDGNADDITDGNNPSAQSGVSFVSGKVDQGISLASVGFIDIPDNANLNLQTFTIDAWVKPKAPSTRADQFGDVIFQKALSLSSTPQTSYHLSWSSVDNKWQVLLGHTAGSQGHHTSTGTYAPDRFYNVAVTYDGTTLRLYVDGMLDSSVNIGKSIMYSTEQAVIGSNAKIFRDVGFFRTWQGVIDELELYDRALSDSEILAIFNAGSAGKCKPIPVTFDIKFCSLPNAFNCKRTRGNVPLTIFGSADLDVSQIDISSLRLALASDPGMATGVPTSTLPLADRGSPGDVDAADDDCVENVATTDGLLDLDVGFSAAEVAILIGCPIAKKSFSDPLIVTGTLIDGTPLEAVNTQVLRN